MKKKGLIISTVVMVVVLIASLTTATYAWFTTSNVTSISGFDVEVVSSNAVNIGLKANCTYDADAIESAFVTGDCNYTASTAGTLGGGSWTGEEGLSATLTHNISWGAQKKAVGVVNTDIEAATSATLANTGLWNIESGTKAIAANMVKNESKANVLGNQTFATANTDYAYFFLGAAPTKALTSNELVIMVDTNGSTNVGIMAALHVAYRLNGNGEWTDADIYDNVHYNQKTADLASNLTDTQKATYKDTYDTDAPTTGVRQFAITGLATAKDQIDQIEIVIYIAGSDSDCVDAAKGSKGAITMFFNVVADNSSPQQ